MKEEDENSPLPWHLNPELDEFTDDPILDANNEPILTTDYGFYGPSNADAALIVEAVNNYSRLRQHQQEGDK